MNHISELSNSLNGYFGWHKSRMNCFAGMLLSLFAVKTVNLREIAVGFGSKAKVDSRYKRLSRFFAQFEIDLTVVARWIVKLFFSQKDKFYLIVDRTNWYLGKQKINILTLAIGYEGIAIPVFWSLLNKAGNSTSKEQIDLITRFINIFGKECIEGLIADREFANHKLFSWLIMQKIPFFIRIKDNTEIKVFRSKAWSAKKLFNYVKPKSGNFYPNYITAYGVKVLLTGARSERGELLIVASNTKSKNAVPIYLRRWEIENLFQSLKTRGFNFESTRITKPERIEKLMAVLAIGFCFAHKIGESLDDKEPIKFKKLRRFSKTEICPQYSFFRYGLDFIRDIILHIHYKMRQFMKCLTQLKIPIYQQLEIIS